MVTIPSRRSAGHRPRAVLAATLFVTTSVSLVTAGTVASGTAAPSASSGTVSGVVFNDKNGNGAYETDAGEVGVAGSQVRAYDRTGALVGGPATTASNGTYQLTITNADSADLRVEFTTPTGYQPSPHGTDNGTSIQFVSVNDVGVDFGVLNPLNFCRDNPDVEGGSVVATCYYPGATTWGPSSEPATRDTIKTTKWDGGGDYPTQSVAAVVDTGALWGVGVQPTTGLVFTSAVIRRHSDLGPKGIGGLYVVDPTKEGVVASFDLASLFAGQGVQFTDNASKWTRANRGIVTPGDPTSSDPALGLSKDIPGWDGVGTEGIGDIDVSDDGQYLWVMNLYEKTVLRIALTGTATAPALGALTEFAVPTNICQVTGSNERPWALDPQPDGTVRVGVVCDNAAAQADSSLWDLANLAEGAFVYSLNPGTTTWTELLEIDLASRPRFDPMCGQTGGQNPLPEDGKCWGAWIGTWTDYTSPPLTLLIPRRDNIYQYGQPMLVDIDTIPDGSMIMSFNDRTSMQVGWENLQPTNSPTPSWPEENATYEFISNWVMGDTILACSQVGGGWAVETAGSCSGINSYSGVVNAADQGSDAPYGEFFRDNYADVHFETTVGGVAVHPNGKTVARTVMDPCFINEGGVVWNKMSDGTRTSTCVTYTGKDLLGNSAGFVKSASMGDIEYLCDTAPLEIGNRFWVDVDEDGIQDPGEPPIAGVRLALYTLAGDIVGFAVTDAKGEYYFTSLLTFDTDTDGNDNVGGGLVPYQSFRIEVDETALWEGEPLDSTSVSVTQADQVSASGNSDAVDSDFQLVDGKLQAIVDPLAPGVSNHTIDAGFVVSYFAVGDYTWIDENGDGLQDESEPPLAGVLVELYKGSGELVDSVETDENGFYFFDGLLAGEYQIKFIPPAGYDYTGQYSGESDADSNPWVDGLTDYFFLKSDATDTVADTDPDTLASYVNPTIDAGFVTNGEQVVAVGDYTWFDENGDGLQTAGEPPVPGVTVELYDANGDPAVDADGNPVDPVVTDANGFYLFDNLLPGDYQIRFIPPDGYDFTSQYSGGAEEDSNAWIDGWTDLFTVSPDDPDTVADTDPDTLASYVNPTIDAGFVESDGPRLFAVGNYTWFDRNADGIQDPEERPVPGVLVELYDANGDPALDADGNPVDPVETDENGFYLFDNLLAGDYRIRFVPPEGYDFTTQYSGGSEDDSNADPTDGWTDVFTVDLGDADTIGDTDDGTVASFVNPTIDAGFVAPLVAMGDYTWYDLDGDGLQDASEDPLEGVKVQLLNPDGSIALDADGNPVPAVFTDENGYYFIDNLLPGEYRVRFTLPNGLNYAFTQQQAGSDTADDSNPDPTTGLTPVFTIAGSVDGETVADTDPGTVASFVNPTIDAGVVPVVAISNFMWFDFDLDGVRDPEEDPVVGGEVYLLDANGDPVTDADGNPVGPASTDENGFFRFDNLLPGEYRLLFVPPPGYAFTRRGGDDTDAADSNANPGGLTDVFRVDAQPLSATDVDDDDSTLALLANPTVGAGLVPVVAVGNYTWIDTNRNGIQDPGELPIAGVLVELLNPDGSPALDADGNPVVGVRTDANGRYFIDNLVPGDYRIRFTPPPGYLFTVDGAGNAVNDSNPARDTGLTPVFRIGGSVGGDTLADTSDSTVALFVNPTIDAGFVPATLPATGTSVPTMLALAAAIVGLGWMLMTSRRHRCNG